MIYNCFKGLMILYFSKSVLFWWFNNKKTYKNKCLQKQALSSWCLSFLVASVYKTHLFSAPKISLLKSMTHASYFVMLSWWLHPSISIRLTELAFSLCVFSTLLTDLASDSSENQLVLTVDSVDLCSSGAVGLVLLSFCLLYFGQI